MAGDAVKVAVRVRPPFPEEQSQYEEGLIEVAPESAQVIVANEHVFSFDYAFNTSTTQEDLYARCVADLVGKITTGYNCCVVMYGQTGSGKTYTMGTNYGQSQVAAANPGIIPRALQDLYSCLSQQQEGHWTVKVSFLEIYNEDVFDLLANPKDREAIHIREVGEFIVLPGLVHREVGSHEEALQCLEQGSRNRSTGATVLNSCSSRSHAIFSVQLQGQVEGTMFTSKLQLVDLAGSEAVKMTDSTGDRTEEGLSINLGLLALGNVINSLCSGQTQYISYRDSSLTRILRDSLNGDSFTVMIACISPVICNANETVSTLHYADWARQIKTKPTINRVHKASTPYRRNLDMPPSPLTQSCRWQAGYRTPVCRALVPGKSEHNSSLRVRRHASAVQLESTPLVPALEEGTSAAASFMAAENLLPVSKQVIPALTPLVERLYERLQPTLCKGISKKLESVMAQSCLGNAKAIAVEHKLTKERQTPVDRLDATLQQRKRRTTGRTPLQDATNTPDSLKRKRLSSSGSKERRGSWKSSPDLCRRSYHLQKNADAENEIANCEDLREAPCDSTQQLPDQKLQAPLPQGTSRRAQAAHNKNVLKLLNTAPEKDLQLLAKVGPKRARMLYLHRTLRGEFKTFEDLKKVEDFGGISFFHAFMSANILTK